MVDTTVRTYARLHPQYGYRLIARLMQADGCNVNHKRVERIWRQEGLQQPKRKAYKPRYSEGGDVKQRTGHIIHVWSKDRTENGQRVRILAVMGEFKRQYLMLYTSTSIPSTKVVDISDWIVMGLGMPEHIRSDSGSEFVAQKVKLWIAQ